MLFGRPPRAPTTPALHVHTVLANPLIRHAKVSRTASTDTAPAPLRLTYTHNHGTRRASGQAAAQEARHDGQRARLAGRRRERGAHRRQRGLVCHLRRAKVVRGGQVEARGEGVVLARGHAARAQVRREDPRRQSLAEGHQAVARARRQLLRAPGRHVRGRCSRAHCFRRSRRAVRAWWPSAKMDCGRACGPAAGCVHGGTVCPSLQGERLERVLVMGL